MVRQARRKGRAKRRTRPSHKAIARKYFELVGQGRFQDGLRFFSEECVTHNPYIAGTMEDIANEQAAASRDSAAMFPEPYFTVEHVLEDGDLVAVHTVLLGARTKPAEGGLRQVHLFRFRGDEIVEYWDITQMVTRDMPNAAGAF